jgi:hypothetical protein
MARTKQDAADVLTMVMDHFATQRQHPKELALLSCVSCRLFGARVGTAQLRNWFFASGVIQDPGAKKPAEPYWCALD